jgi:hypothetical protein
MKQLTAQPFRVDFGANYRGSHLAGSFQVLGANKFKSLKCFSESPNLQELADDSVPPWIKLGEPVPTAQGIGWSFQVDTASVGFRSASLTLGFDNGTSTVNIRAAIRAGKPQLGDLVICDSPFDCYTDWRDARTLTRVLKGLDFRMHYLDAFARRSPHRPKTILLHGKGLIDSAQDHLSTLIKLVDSGTNLIVLADKFFQGTADAANVIGERYGMRLRTGEGGGFSSIEQMERAANRCSNRAQVRRHPVTKGVRRLSWYRPWPIDCVSKRAIPLVTDSEDPKACYVAAAKPKDYVVLVGTSLWSSMTSVGWPFDNDRLFANLLIGGDADG